MKRTRDMITEYHPSSIGAMSCPFCTQPYYQRGNTRHLHVFCEGKNLKAMRQVCYEILERKLDESVSTAEEIRYSNTNMVPHLLDFMRGFLREDELAPYKLDAWKEQTKGENEAILEPRDWQEKQNKFSPSSELQNGMKIAHRMSIRIPHALQIGNNSS